MESRIQSAMHLYLFAGLGVFLLAAPWSPVWEQATVILLPTSIGALVRSGWARGIVSGLGALNLLVAVQEADRLWRSLRSRHAGGRRP